MNSLARSIVGVAVTAAAVYLLDPVSGHQRRVMLQDRARRATRRLDVGTRSARRNAWRNASERYFATREARDNAPNRHRPNRLVRKMVFGAIRQAASHPESIHVAVDHGHVILRGHLHPHEHQRLLDEVRRQPGVLVVTDHLNEHMGNGQFGEFAVDRGRAFRSAAGIGPWGITGRVLAGCAGGALLIWGIRERKALGEFGMAIAEEFQHAMDRNLREGFDDTRQTAEDAGEGMSDRARRAGKKVEEGMDWAESASSDVIEEYAQKRRADATH